MFNLFLHILLSVLVIFPLYSFFATIIIRTFNLDELKFYDGNYILKLLIAMSFLTGFAFYFVKYIHYLYIF